MAQPMAQIQPWAYCCELGVVFTFLNNEWKKKVGVRPYVAHKVWPFTEKGGPALEHATLCSVHMHSFSPLQTGYLP